MRPNRMAQAIERNPDSLWRLLAQYAKGASSEVRYGVSMVALGTPHQLFNLASCTRIPFGQEDEAIAYTIEYFAQKGKPWSWQVNTISEPRDLKERLVAAGLVHSHDNPGMAYDLHGYRPQADQGDMREAIDAGTMNIWLDTALAAFNMPREFGQTIADPFPNGGTQVARFFYVCDEGKPVACSMVYFSDGVAGIYTVGTLADARRKGFGEKVMHSCLAAAVEAGYDAAILHATKMGVLLYEKMGFVEYCTISSFVPAPHGEA